MLLFMLSSCDRADESQEVSAKEALEDPDKVEELRARWKRSLYQSPDSILVVANEMIALGEKTQDPEAIFLGNNMLATYYAKTGEYSKAIDFHKSNLEINRNEPRRHFTILNNLGNIYITNGDFEKALETHLNALTLAESSGDMERKTTSLLNVAGVYSHLKKPDESLDYAYQAFELAQSSGVRPVKMQSAYQIAEIYLDAGNDSLALIYADSVMQTAQDLKTTFGMNKARELQAKAFANQGQLLVALDLIRQSKSYYQENENLDQVIIQAIAESTILSDLGRNTQAEGVLLNVIPLAKERDQKEQLWKMYQLLAKVQEEQGKLLMSYRNYKNYKLYQDSVVSIEKNNAIERLSTEFETEKKEAQIQSLSQQSEIQTLQIRQRNQTILIGVVVVILVFVVLYFLYAQRDARKQRKQTELEQRFLRSQLNPHFISNALVSVQSSLSDQDTENAQLYLEKFSRLMREILENSRKEFISVSDELDMLRDYLDINVIRSSEKFTYTIDVDEDIEDDMDQIPPMFIQPFVENAIEHGLKPGGNGRIAIKLKKLEETIAISIDDNGSGIDSNAKTESGKRSLSTQIIKERIALYNRSLRNKITLLIENIHDENGEIAGTHVALQVPVR